MKKWITILLTACLLGGCGFFPGNTGPKVYDVTYFTLFDTITMIKGTARSEADFLESATLAHETLLRYHQLFDIYNDYEGINNLKTVNDNAGIVPVKVDPEIIALLQDCVRYYELTGGKTNVAMGSILGLWHDARSAGTEDPINARLPDPQALLDATAHTDIACLVIDAENSTVYLSDPEARLDVGAVAKGWAAQRVAEQLPSGMLLNLGGNICATGPKQEGEPWIVGVRDPRGGDSDYLYTLSLNSGSVVTSGDYQRSYTVDGRAYHHIIDPETRMPSAYWRSVTVICEDSALADALSTALFLLPLQEGQALAERCDVDVLWINEAGEEFMTPGFQNLINS